MGTLSQEGETRDQSHNQDARISPNEPNHEALSPTSASTLLGHGKAWRTLFLLLAPAVAAIWLTPWFVTQDGPAHVYNAEILSRSLTSNSPFQDYYEIHWRPFPNWGGHLVLAGLMAILPTRVADLTVTTLTLIGFSGALVWLRQKVRGPENLLGAALLATLLGLNITWLLGFTSFLLGACLFPIMLGIWWSWRDEGRFAGIATLMILVVVSYFCHLVSLGLTVVGIGVLALATPLTEGRSTGWRNRFLRTGLGLTPLLILGPLYLRLSSQEGGASLYPVWSHLGSYWRPSAWVAQFGWVEPISLASKTSSPFIDRNSPILVLLSPIFWLMFALAFWAIGLLCEKTANPNGHLGDPASSLNRRDLRGWWGLAILLLLGGYFGPDSFGPRHGEFLPQRLVLFGLAALIPVIDLETGTRTGRAAIGALALAVVFQTLTVWDYGLRASSEAKNFVAARESVGTGARVGTLLTRTKTRFRANPLLHADNWLGIGTGNIVWSNYETRFYYFPVHFQEGLTRPDPEELERLSLMEGPYDQKARAEAWERLLARNAESIDFVVRWKEDARLDEITQRWFEPANHFGDLTIFRKRESDLVNRKPPTSRRVRNRDDSP